MSGKFVTGAAFAYYGNEREFHAVRFVEDSVGSLDALLATVQRDWDRFDAKAVLVRTYEGDQWYYLPHGGNFVVGRTPRRMRVEMAEAYGFTTREDVPTWWVPTVKAPKIVKADDALAAAAGWFQSPPFHRILQALLVISGEPSPPPPSPMPPRADPPMFRWNAQTRRWVQISP